MLHTRCDAALADARATFERVIAVLREENSLLRRHLEAAHRRADEQATALVKSLVVSATPLPTVAPDRRPTSKDPIAGLGNVLDDLPLGHPDGVFTDERAASLMMADEPPHGARTAA
jgi:hypothetical protein